MNVLREGLGPLVEAIGQFFTGGIVKPEIDELVMIGNGDKEATMPLGGPKGQMSITAEEVESIFRGVSDGLQNILSHSQDNADWIQSASTASKKSLEDYNLEQYSYWSRGDA